MATATRSGSRKRATPANTTTTTKATADEVTCPECGKTFSRPAALGAHRARVHGVAGTSQNARSRRNAAARNTATTRTHSSRARMAAQAATSAASRNGGVDHDALLRALFPNGIPPQQDTIAAVNDWLAQADRLARQR